MKYGSALIKAFCIVVLGVLFYGGYASDSSLSTPADYSNAPIRRVISLSPQNTEIIFALGAGDKLVGVTNYCDFPAEALEKEKIGDFINIDVEKIISLSPDVIIANNTLQEKNVRVLKQAGISVVVVQNDTLDELLISIEEIGTLIGVSENGVLLRKELETRRKEILAKKSQGKSPRVFIEIWDHPLLTTGNRSYIHDLIAQAGGINVAANTPNEYHAWDIEKLYASNPDIYLRLRGTDMGSKAAALPADFQELRAVKEGKVITLFDNAFVRSGPRSIDVLEQLVEVLNSKE